jgi:CO/xanthine dehydrogenase Mo-binding subunit
VAATYSIIGQPVPARVDGTGKVTGATRYADDLFLPRMLYGKLLRSPHPHARILHVDTRKATALQCFFSVITWYYLPQRFSFMKLKLV